MGIERFSDADAESWDRFVETSVNGTFMHSRRFLSYHPPDRFRDHSLWFVDNQGRVKALFPAAVVEFEGRQWLQSHPGATYGGLVVDDRCVGPEFDELLRLLVEYASGQGFAGIRVRLSESVFLQKPCGELDAALFRNGFSLKARELSCAVPLMGLSEGNLLGRMTHEIRTAVNKSLRTDAVTRFTEDFASYWTVLENNLSVRHDVCPTHSLAEILRLRELLGDRVQLIGTYLHDELIAGVVLFRMNKFAAHTMYFAQDYRHRKLKPMTLAVYQTIVECCRLGLRHLNFGISSVPGTDGHVMNWGLYEFKRRFGTEGVVRDTWCLEFPRRDAAEADSRIASKS